MDRLIQNNYEADMARPREFDPKSALAKARRVFWERGYEATSLCDLLDATGLSRSSLYQAFGGKRSLFLAALEDYLADGRARLEETLASAPSPFYGLERWLEAMVDMAARGRPRRGCFGVNTLVELAPHDPEIRKALARHEEAVAGLYAGALRRAVESGEARPDVDPDAAAHMIRTLVHGLQVAGRARIDERHLDVAKLALDGLRRRSDSNDPKRSNS